MSGQADNQVRTHVHIGTTAVPVTEFEVVSGSYGSVGSARMTTSRALLDTLQIDLEAVASAATVVPVAIWAEAGSTPTTQIFDGDVLTIDWDMDRDTVSIHARDHAGVFVDQKRILARDAKALTSALSPLSPGQVLSPTGVATMNRQVSQVVSDIASEFGYTPVIQMGQGTDILTGALYGSSDHVYMTIPQNLWQILNTLARDTGNEVYTTPDRRLVFGEPGLGLPTLQFSWRTTPLLPPGLLPCAHLNISHNHRRNSTFRVLVTSYDPSKATATIGRATVIGPDMADTNLPAGIHTGSDAQAVDKTLLNEAKTKLESTSGALSHVQLYTFHWDGLTNDDANARAAAIATDIMKRLLILKCTIDGLPTITPTQKLTVQGTIPDAFSSNIWYTSGFRHRFQMPKRGSRSSWAGFTTEIHALDLPTNALNPK